MCYFDHPDRVPKNEVRSFIRFVKPSMVTVKEQYIIYDTVALISAIGGTMGLCIGVSFSGISSFMLENLKLCIDCLAEDDLRRSKRFKVSEKRTEKLSWPYPGLFFTDFPATTETGISKTLSLVEKILEFSQKSLSFIYLPKIINLHLSGLSSIQ